MGSNADLLQLMLEEQRRAARTDLHAFTRRMFLRRRGFPWRDAPHHAKICAALQRVFDGECQRLIINVPPRYSKTELAVVNFMAWALGRCPDAEFIHTSYSATLAANNSAAVRDMVQHDAYREIFDGVHLATQAQAHWKTTEGGVVYAAGAGGTITGFGAGKMRDSFGGAIIIDDPHKADEARSDIVRQGVIDWFGNTLESRKNYPERTPIILIMQRLHQQDLSGWLLGDRKPGGPAVPGGNGEIWEHLCLDVWQPDGTPLWLAKHSATELLRMEQANPYMFSGQYRQRPSPPEGGVFRPGMIETVDAMPAVPIQWVRAWDFADSTGGDFTAGPKLGKLPDGRFVIGGMERERFTTDKRDALILNTAKRDGRQVRISIPQDPGQAGKGQVLAMTRMLAGFAVHHSPESGDKVTRAETFASQVNVGNVLMLRGDWNEPMLEEMRMFPNGTYDDQVDGLSRAFEALMTGQGIFQTMNAGGL